MLSAVKAPLPSAAALVSLLIAALGGACAPPPPAPAPTASRPAGPERIVLVSIDTLRADYVGCYGARRARTPRLDAIARRGVRFETAISPTPLTLPSHVSLLTGLDPSRHGVHDNALFRLEEGIPTLADAFRSAGLATAGFVASVVLNRVYGLDRGFDHYDDALGYRRTTSGSGGLAERPADQVVDAVLAWLEQAPDRFFLWVHFYDPHASYSPPEAFAPDPSRIPRIPRDATFMETLRLAVPPYYEAEIAFADTQLGRLLDAIDARFPGGRTLLAVTSDHGESLGEHGELTHSLSVYDATQKVPLLLAGPGLPAGRVVAAPVRLVDVAPTLLAAAGLPPLPETTGVDLGPWIRGERDDGLDAYVETLATQIDYGWSPVFGLRTRTAKYLRMPRPELYDLAADPAERVNLAASDASVAAELDAALTARLEGARPARPNSSPLAGDRELLQSLGYVVGAPGSDEYVLGVVEGADPKDRMSAIRAMLEANSAIGAGQPERALEILEGVPEANGWIEQARAEASAALGDWKAFERHARKVAAARPGEPEASLLLGQAKESVGKHDEARSAYRRSLEADPTRVEAITGLGRLAEAEGDIATAIVHYDEAIAARNPSAEAALLRAALYLESGRPYQARLLLRDAWEAPGIPASARKRLIRAEAGAGYPKLAVERLRSILDRPREQRELSDFFKEIVETYGGRVR
jgi:choline-sulfatase